MGFHITDIGYLWYLQERGWASAMLKTLEIVGSTFKDATAVPAASCYNEQKEWRNEAVIR